MRPNDWKHITKGKSVHREMEAEVTEAKPSAIKFA